MDIENTVSGVWGCLMSLYLLISQIATMCFLLATAVQIPFWRLSSWITSCQSLKGCSGYSLYSNLSRSMIGYKYKVGIESK